MSRLVEFFDDGISGMTINADIRHSKWAYQ